MVSLEEGGWWQEIEKQLFIEPIGPVPQGRELQTEFPGASQVGTRVRETGLGSLSGRMSSLSLRVCKPRLRDQSGSG